MKYVITNQDDNNFVILGPMEWKSNYFSSVIAEETGHPVRLKDSDKDKVPFAVHDKIIIRRCEVVYEQIDSDIQQHAGPFIEYKTGGSQYGYAVATYKAEYKNLTILKDEIANKIAKERWKTQSALINIDINGIQHSVDTQKETRDILLQKYILMSEDSKINFKFPFSWVEISKQDVLNIINKIDEHVQRQFDWENEIMSIVRSTDDYTQLKSIIVENVKTPRNNKSA